VVIVSSWPRGAVAAANNQVGVVVTPHKLTTAVPPA
jgi:hypothetical protein